MPERGDDGQRYTSGMANLEVGTIRRAIEAARARGIRRVRLREEDGEFNAVLPPAPKRKPATAQVRAVVERDLGPDEVTVTAPVVGYYREVAGGLAVGQTVAAGDLVAEILALGLANDVRSPIAGEVTEVHATPGAPLQYGEPVLTVRPTA